MAISDEIRKLLGSRQQRPQLGTTGAMPQGISPQGIPQQGLPPTGLPQAPPTGLIGSEQALRQGLAGAGGVFEQAALQGRRDVTGGVGAALAGLGVTGQQVGQQIGQGQAALAQAGQQVGQQIGQGVGGLQPFVSPGQQAQQQQAAMAGALGPEAQAQAFSQFQESPEQAFLREQGMRSTLAGASATGGLGGGNVLRELSRFGTGLAAQDIQNRFGRLGAVTGTGLQAAGQVGQLRGQQAGLTGALGQASGQLSGQQAGLTSALGQRTAGIQEAGGQNLANLATGAGGQIGGAILGTGQQLAGGRALAGQQLASAIGGTSANLADLISQQGTGVSGLLGQTGGNVANLLSGAADAQAAGDVQLATILSNLAVQQGSTVAGLPGIPGVQQTEGILEGIGKAASAAAAVAASDIRLKGNIKFVGVSKGGFNLYTWDWNSKGAEIAENQPTFGVIAQEVMEICPEAVTVADDGYLRVDYGRIN